MKIIQPKICTNAFKIIDNAIYQCVKNKARNFFKRIKTIKQTNFFFLLQAKNSQKKHMNILISEPIRIYNVRNFHDDKIYELSKKLNKKS